MEKAVLASEAESASVIIAAKNLEKQEVLRVSKEHKCPTLMYSYSVRTGLASTRKVSNVKGHSMLSRHFMKLTDYLRGGAVPLNVCYPT